MSCSPIKLLAAALGLALLAGCIADTPEDSKLPWATNQNWEGMAPIAPSMLDRYD
ncbi:MAG: hypothetical protein IJQ34_09545 [Kiritimatiellae bacterium]|nr:hypothetical protein [Kiritimatiellia bacterium]